MGGVDWQLDPENMVISLGDEQRRNAGGWVQQNK